MIHCVTNGKKSDMLTIRGYLERLGEKKGEISFVGKVENL